jgi:folate-dependent phosphoribosylglycinamide formyltransferase PurN
MGHVPVGALSLSTLNRGTVLRKIGQWGVREVARYARAKLIPSGNGPTRVRNPHLQPLLDHKNGTFRSIREVSTFYGFPLTVCKNQNAPNSIAQLRAWSPDLIIFTGGNILRKPLLEAPRFGVLNAHLGLLPEVRGMASPEWSLLKHVPVGVTIHYMDAGIDTGPILQRYEFPDVAACESLSDLRNRLIAFGIEKVGEVVSALDRGTISATPQSDLQEDRQFFVMHEWLQARAAERLTRTRTAAITGTVHG